METNNKSQEKIVRGYIRYLKLERNLSVTRWKPISATPRNC